MVDANGGVTRQHYNEFEELDVTINPEGYSRRTAFNEFGLPVLTTDEDGRQTRYTYDARRNLTSVTTPEGGARHGNTTSATAWCCARFPAARAMPTPTRGAT